MKALKALFACVLLMACVACEKKVDTVKIKSIYPHADAPLHTGKKVNFSVEVEYDLETASSGTVALVIQQEEEEADALKTETRVVRKGKGTVVIEADVVIPATNALMVFTPLTPQGSTKTEVVDLRTYEVLKE